MLNATDAVIKHKEKCIHVVNTNIEPSNTTSDEVSNLIYFEQGIENPNTIVNEENIECKMLNASDAAVKQKETCIYIMNKNIELSNNTSDEANNLINFDQENGNPIISIQKKNNVKCKTFNASDAAGERKVSNNLAFKNDNFSNDTSDEVIIKENPRIMGQKSSKENFN